MSRNSLSALSFCDARWITSSVLGMSSAPRQPASPRKLTLISAGALDCSRLGASLERLRWAMSLEMDDLLRWIRAFSRRAEVFAVRRVNDLEQANGLEKIKAVSFGEQSVFDRRGFSPTVVVYSRAVSPAIGSHRFQIPSRCLLLITN